MKVYTYKDVEYKSEHSVRQAIWKYERKAVGVCETPEDWGRHGVVYTEVEVPLTEEKMASQIREKRDRLLAACDYYVMPDYPKDGDRFAEVLAYRQALRDITKQPGFPKMVTWPDKPSVL